MKELLRWSRRDPIIGLLLIGTSSLILIAIVLLATLLTTGKPAQPLAQVTPRPLATPTATVTPLPTATPTIPAAVLPNQGRDTAPPAPAFVYSPIPASPTPPR